VSKAQDAVAAAKKKDDSAALADAQESLQTAKENRTQAKHRATAAQKAVDDERSKLSTANVVTLVVEGVLILLYLVPLTALTGRTFGMRRRHIKVVRVDGSPVTWAAAFIRFAVPVVIALALFPALQSLAFAVGLGLVLWGFRDPNKQGIHDKLAKTIVVNDT
jgi:hypothetical protein